MSADEFKYGDKVVYTDPNTGIEHSAVVCGCNWCEPGRIGIFVHSFGCDEDVDVANLRME